MQKSILRAVSILVIQIFLFSNQVFALALQTGLQEGAGLTEQMKQEALLKLAVKDSSRLLQTYVPDNGLIKRISEESKRQRLSEKELLNRLLSQGYSLRQTDEGKIYLSRGLLGGMDESPGGRDKPWGFDPSLFHSSQWIDKGLYRLHEAGSKDMAFVQALYNKYPVAGHVIDRVYIIDDKSQTDGFQRRVVKLNSRANKDAFKSTFEQESDGENKTHKISVDNSLKSMSYILDILPDVRLVPMWHGTSFEAFSSILETGFASLASRDSGYFGKGYYGTDSAEYSHRVYGKVLLLNWMSCYSAYPVTKQDSGFMGKSNYKHYDAHFIPVVPNNPDDPNESAYFPTEPGQEPVFNEMVVFNPDQIFLRYVVELKPRGQAHASPSFIDKLIDAPVIDDKTLIILEKDIDIVIESIKESRLENNDIKEELSTYIPVNGKWDIDDEDVFDLEKEVTKFLGNDKKKVMLMLGDSGTGKTMFGKRLEQILWQKYEGKEEDYIPVYISLPSLQDPFYSAATETLEGYGFSQTQIEKLKETKKFLFYMDGYDELYKYDNLYTTNKLSEWNAKVITTCRGQFVNNMSGYTSLFMAKKGRRLDHKSFMEMNIAPFSDDQINAYLKKYIEVSETDWDDWKQYRENIDKIPGLKKIIRTPFILKIITEVLPEIVEKHERKSSVESLKLMKIDLYDAFIERWFEIEQDKLIEERRMEGEDMIPDFYEFSKKLALKMQEERVTNAIYIKGNEWEPFFTTTDERTLILRKACPLKRSGEKAYSFIHKSVMEHFIYLAGAGEILKDFTKIKEQVKTRLNREKKIKSKQEKEKELTRLTQEEFKKKINITGYTINQKLINDEPEILKNYAELVEKNLDFKVALFGIVERSKEDPNVSTSSANAMTILNAARVPFSGMDLSGIRIPGADLSGAVLDRTNLSGSDLRKVELRQTWLGNTDLRGAEMGEVIFGEKPYLEGHTRAVTSVAYSPDGKTLASVSDDYKIMLWEAQTGKRKATIEGHIGGMFCVVYSPNGKTLAVGRGTNEIMLWEAQTGKRKVTIKGHGSWVTSVVYSPDGKTLASGSLDKIRLWDAESGKHKVTLEGHTRAVTSVAYSPDGKTLATGSDDKTIRLWDAESGKHKATFEGHGNNVTSVAYSPDGKTLATGGADNKIILWDAQTGKRKATLEGHSSYVTSVVYRPDGKTLASGSYDNKIMLWDAETGKRKATLEGHGNNVTSVAYSPDGKTLATGSDDKTIRLWDAESGKHKATIEGHSDNVLSVAYNPDGKTLATGSDDKKIMLWDAETGKRKATLEDHTNWVNSVCYSPDGKSLASGGGYGDNKIMLWDAQTGKRKATLEGHSCTVNCVCYSPDGKSLASGSWDNKIMLWEAQTGKRKATLEGHGQIVNSVVYSPDGKTLASGSVDSKIMLWEAQTGKRKATLEGHRGYVTCVVYSPDGKSLASGSKDNKIMLWDAETGKRKATLEGHSDWVVSVSYNPDGKTLATGSYDKKIMLWDAETGKRKATLEGHTNMVRSVVYSPDGKMLATGSDDNSIKIWRINEADGKTKATLISSTNHHLFLKGSNIEGVKGLSEINKRLLKQRGAVGEPAGPTGQSSHSLSPSFLTSSAKVQVGATTEEDVNNRLETYIKNLKGELDITVDFEGDHNALAENRDNKIVSLSKNSWPFFTVNEIEMIISHEVMQILMKRKPGKIYTDETEEGKNVLEMSSIIEFVLKYSERIESFSTRLEEYIDLVVEEGDPNIGRFKKLSEILRELNENREILSGLNREGVTLIDQLRGVGTPEAIHLSELLGENVLALRSA